MSSQHAKTVVVDGLALAQEIRQELAERITNHLAAGKRPPCLAVVLVGNDSASQSYIKGKRRACKRIGMESVEYNPPDTTTESELVRLIGELNGDSEVDGILVQLPLPPQIHPSTIAATVDPLKDVDGLHPVNNGKLLAGDDGLCACTPLGIMEILDRHKVELRGSHAVVIGRSMIVGKPVSLLLQQRHATVTMCHSRTRNLAEICQGADVLVAAIGKPRMVKAEWIRPGAAVIDVGVTEVNGELVGDVDFEAAIGTASLITPHRGGVGPMTITMLLANTVRAYENRVWS